MEKIWTELYESPCGTLLLGSYAGRLCLCDWAGSGSREAVRRRLSGYLRAEYGRGGTATTREAARQLDAYFRRERAAFDLPLLQPGTPFQRAVWRQLLAIPYGTTLTYAELARRTGNPKAARAVANANRANALSLFVPCHRVVGSDGSPSGYAGGTEAKRFLLALERGAGT